MKLIPKNYDAKFQNELFLDRKDKDGNLGKKIIILQERTSHMKQMKLVNKQIDNNLPWGYAHGKNNDMMKKKMFDVTQRMKGNRRKMRMMKSEKRKEVLKEYYKGFDKLNEDEKRLYDGLMNMIMKKKKIDGKRIMNKFVFEYNENRLFEKYSGYDMLKEFSL